ncbi:hypothetical protein BH11BAC5_BH11BAC5_33570 [soil metagenome]
MNGGVSVTNTYYLADAKAIGEWVVLRLVQLAAAAKHEAEAGGNVFPITRRLLEKCGALHRLECSHSQNIFSHQLAYRAVKKILGHYLHYSLFPDNGINETVCLMKIKTANTTPEINLTGTKNYFALILTA